MHSLSKSCFKCLETKPLSGFYKHSKMRDGYLNKCIECAKADVHANRQLRLNYYQAYDRSRGCELSRIEARKAYASTESGKAVILRGKRKWAEANPLRIAATVAVRNAVRDGRLQKLPCFVCGVAAEAHHPDYSLPLAVSWLCDQHHKQVHKEHRERLRLGAF